YFDGLNNTRHELIIKNCSSGSLEDGRRRLATIEAIGNSDAEDITQEIVSAGGIVGYTGTIGENYLKIDTCEVVANVKAHTFLPNATEEFNVNQKVYAGGLIGICRVTTWIANSKVTGEIDGSRDKAKIEGFISGGAIGKFDSSDWLTITNLVITNIEISAYKFVGGVIGEVLNVSNRDNIRCSATLTDVTLGALYDENDLVFLAYFNKTDETHRTYSVEANKTTDTITYTAKWETTQTNSETGEDETISGTVYSNEVEKNITYKLVTDQNYYTFVPGGQYGITVGNDRAYDKLLDVSFNGEDCSNYTYYDIGEFDDYNLAEGIEGVEKIVQSSTNSKTSSLTDTYTSQTEAQTTVDTKANTVETTYDYITGAEISDYFGSGYKIIYKIPNTEIYVKLVITSSIDEDGDTTSGRVEDNESFSPPNYEAANVFFAQSLSAGSKAETLYNNAISAYSDLTDVQKSLIWSAYYIKRDQGTENDSFQYYGKVNFFSNGDESKYNKTMGGVRYYVDNVGFATWYINDTIYAIIDEENKNPVWYSDCMSFVRLCYYINGLGTEYDYITYKIYNHNVLRSFPNEFINRTFNSYSDDILPNLLRPGDVVYTVSGDNDAGTNHILMFSYYDEVTGKYHFIDQSHIDRTGEMKTKNGKKCIMLDSGDSRPYYRFAYSTDLYIFD
ncbi:MAG: hypothetical protein ACI4PF_03080, partial [Christensenellales bacterium]